ncbi:hypothetical protein VaNZ11_009015 [Volvox africanus]|uniref:Uncharacterized protein n=1 Tax=Volvox africanus TaxID=51714 RepID=A0ABQ5S6D5_9CHLO|nr:hypothetical protein VaNZ11_009015 [Volvox africanus]
MSESSGDTPDWLRQHTETPIKIFIASSSDDDDDIVLVRRNISVPSGFGGGPGPSQRAATAAQVGQDEGLQQSAQQPGDLAKATCQRPKRNADQQAAKDEETQPLPELSQQSALPESSQKQVERRQQQADAQLVAGVPSIAANIGGALEAGKLPIMLPEKLNRNKVLLELPAAPASGEHYHGAADLSGDSGAVGRIVIVGAGASGKGAAATGGLDGGALQIDLKGVMYNAWVLPLATTALVLNIGPTEAKVESLFNDFIRLREVVHPCLADEDRGDARLAYLLDGDDENYQVGGGDGDDASGQGAKISKGPGKPRKRAADKAAGGGPEKKAKTSKKAASSKADKKDGTGAGVGAKKAPAGAAKKKAKNELRTAREGKKSAGPKKTPEAKKAAAKTPAEKGKKTTTQGLGVQAGSVTKRASTGRKKQTTLRAFAAAAKPGSDSSE